MAAAFMAAGRETSINSTGTKMPNKAFTNIPFWPYLGIPQRAITPKTTPNPMLPMIKKADANLITMWTKSRCIS